MHTAVVPKTAEKNAETIYYITSFSPKLALRRDSGPANVDHLWPETRLTSISVSDTVLHVKLSSVGPPTPKTSCGSVPTGNPSPSMSKGLSLDWGH